MTIDQQRWGVSWEAIVGYSRAVSAGPFVVVAGTTTTGEHGELIGGDSAYEQTRQALRNVVEALEHAAASVEDVIQTR